MNPIHSSGMDSVEVLNPQNNSGSFSSNEYSLLPDAYPQNEVVNDHVNGFDLTNMQSSFNVPSSDSMAVHSHFSDLMRENNRLKENLSKNNSMMEAQIETIQSWRDQMLLSKNQVEEKLKQEIEKNLSLEKEKAELQEQVINVIKMHEEENVKTCERCTSFEATLNTVLGTDCEKEGIFSRFSDFHENLSGNLKTVCSYLENFKSNSEISAKDKCLLDSYILILKCNIASLDGIDTKQSKMDYSLRTDEETGYEVVCEKTSEKEEREINQLKEKLKEKEDQLFSLMKAKEEFDEKLKESELKIKEWEMALKSQYEVMNNKLETEYSLAQRYKERCEHFEKQIEEYQVKLDESRMRMADNQFGGKSDDHVVQELREEVHNLQEILKLEQKSNQSDREKLRETMESCEKLQVDYVRVTQLLEVQLKDDKEKNEKLASIESEAKKFMEEADHQTAKLFAVQEQLIDVTEEADILRKQVEEIKNSDNIPLLKAQISSYKRDFLEMQAAKNAASDEVEKLKNELKKGDGSSSPRSLRNSHSRRSSDHRDQNGAAVEVFECPICNFGFTSAKVAENHINKCLEEGNHK